eukprot:scaffold7396_cov15-Tisochrysis_lutea.AAC.1
MGFHFQHHRVECEDEPRYRACRASDLSGSYFRPLKGRGLQISGVTSGLLYLCWGAGMPPCASFWGATAVVEIAQAECFMGQA